MPSTEQKFHRTLVITQTKKGGVTKSMGQANKHAANLADHMRMQHQKRVNSAQAVLSGKSGPQLVKQDTGVTVGKNKAVAGASAQAKQYNGDKSNLDNRLPKPQKQSDSKFYDSKTHRM